MNKSATYHCPECKSDNAYPLFQGPDVDPKGRWGCGDCGAAWVPGAPNLTKPQALTVRHLDIIAATLEQMQAQLERERAELPIADYATSSHLAYVAAYLNHACQFWTQSGPEYEE